MERSYSVVGSEVQSMFGSIAPKYDLANSVLSFGIHHLWRRTLVRMLPKSKDKRVLDLCTGTGDLLPLLQRRFGKAVGADFCVPMMEAGKRKLAKRGYHFDFVQADALALPFENHSFDIITVAFGVRNLENLEKGLSEMRRVLKPGGSLLVLEFGQPSNLIFGPLYRCYSKYVMPVIGGLVTGNKHAYSYLPETASHFPCGAAFEAVLRRVGLAPQCSRSLTFGIAWAYHAQTPA